MDKAGILIIDDEAQMRKLLEITLESNDYKVSYAATGKDGMAKAASYRPDIILLDLGLPDADGHSVLQNLREWYTNPVIILSVQSSEEDIVKALDNGANDYVVKPFRTGELLARIRSCIRSNAGLNPTEMVIETGDIQLDLNCRTVKKNGTILKLTSTEFSLLTLLA